METVVQIIGSGIVASVATLFLSDYLTGRREKDSRQREFRAFLNKWRSEIERIHGYDVKQIWEQYRDAVHQFHYLKGRVRGDFEPVAEFDRLCDKLGGLRAAELRPSEPQGYGPLQRGETAPDHMRDAIAESIDALKRFTNT